MLGYLGISSGAFWDYYLSGLMYGSGTERDSVLLVLNVPGLIGRCVFWSFIPWASIKRVTSSSFGSSIETTFVYFRTDNIYANGRLMFMKYNPYLGESWEAWDTCFIPLNLKVPIGDLDMDGIWDTIWARSSIAQVESLNAGVYTVTISPLKYGVWLSRSSYLFDSIVVWEYYRFKFIPYVGKVEEHLDSQKWRYYRSGSSFDMPVWDVYHKVITTSITESIRNLQVKEESVYSLDGRKLGRSLPKRKGIYILRSGKKSVVK